MAMLLLSATAYQPAVRLSTAATGRAAVFMAKTDSTATLPALPCARPSLRPRACHRHPCPSATDRAAVVDCRSNPADLLKRLVSPEARELQVRRRPSPPSARIAARRQPPAAFRGRVLRLAQGELKDLALKQDPQIVLRRSVDLARALQTVGAETLSPGSLQQPPPPQVVLRRLCEELGHISAISPPHIPHISPYLPVSPQVVLRRLCEELGATYVKLGQFVASSPTLFPPEYVAEFQQCLDSTPPMPWSDVRPLIEAQLGRPLDAVYASVSQTPLAAASIAQVHAARLVSGEDVVIKVQRKGVDGSLRADLDLLYANARVLQLLGVATAELCDVVGVLREAILEEVDFELEATRTEQFASFLARSPELAGVVTVPKVYRAASAQRVLTLERLYGTALTDLETVRQYTPNPELVLIVALNTWISSVLTNEWFHADVHAGNLLVLKVCNRHV